MVIAGIWLLSMLALALALAAASDGQLYLSCHGTAPQSVPSENSVVVAHDNWGNGATAREATSKLAIVDADVGFRMHESEAWLRLPAVLLPELHGGSASWFPVLDLHVSDSEITGKVKINFLRSSTFRIDRVTGELSSSHGFSATCERIDPTQRKF